jgi:hypothetical protein
MADTKISALTADTSPTSDDLIPTVNDPAGTPANKKVTLGDAVTKAHGLSDTTVIGVASGVLAAASTTGSGAVVRATSPALTTPTGIVKGDVGLGNVDNTSDATKAVLSATKWTTARNLAGNSVDGSAAVAFANKFIVQGTTDTGLSAAQFLGSLGTGIVKNTTTTGVLSIAVAADFPILNQSTTGSAATLTTPRTIAGVSFDGSANIAIASTNLSDTASIVLLTSIQTQTNKRITKRVVTVNAPGATPSTNSDNRDISEFTGLNTAITSMTTNLTGTPVNGDTMQFMFVDDGTARAIAWGASFANGGMVNLPTTTVINTVLRVIVQYQTIASLNKWVCVGVA